MKGFIEIDIREEKDIRFYKDEMEDSYHIHIYDGQHILRIHLNHNLTRKLVSLLEPTAYRSIVGK